MRAPWQYEAGVIEEARLIASELVNPGHWQDAILRGECDHVAAVRAAAEGITRERERGRAE